MTDEIETIVVTAQKYNGTGPSSYGLVRVVVPRTQPVTWQPPSGTQQYRTDPAPSGGTGTRASVNVLVTNSANAAQAIKAAENVAKAVIELDAALSALNPSTIIDMPEGFVDTNVGNVLTDLRNTAFVITDKVYANGGVGESVRGKTGTLNYSYLNFSFFDGDGVSDYASSVYANNHGTITMVLHEVAHITSQGDSFNSLSFTNYRLETGAKDARAYPYTPYWYNNEAFAYDFAARVAYLGKINISVLWGQLDSRYKAAPLHPAQLRQDRGPNP